MQTSLSSCSLNLFSGIPLEIDLHEKHHRAVFADISIGNQPIGKQLLDLYTALTKGQLSSEDGQVQLKAIDEAYRTLDRKAIFAVGEATVYVVESILNSMNKSLSTHLSAIEELKTDYASFEKEAEELQLSYYAQLQLVALKSLIDRVRKGGLCTNLETLSDIIKAFNALPSGLTSNDRVIELTKRSIAALEAAPIAAQPAAILGARF